MTNQWLLCAVEPTGQSIEITLIDLPSHYSLQFLFTRVNETIKNRLITRKELITPQNAKYTANESVIEISARPSGEHLYRLFKRPNKNA